MAFVLWVKWIVWLCSLYLDAGGGQLLCVAARVYEGGNGGSEVEKRGTLSCYRHEGPPEEPPSCSSSNRPCWFGDVPVAPVWQIVNPKIDPAASAPENIVFCPEIREGIRKTAIFYRASWNRARRESLLQESDALVGEGWCWEIQEQFQTAE